MFDSSLTYRILSHNGHYYKMKTVEIRLSELNYFS